MKSQVHALQMYAQARSCYRREVTRSTQTSHMKASCLPLRPRSAKVLPATSKGLMTRRGKRVTAQPTQLTPFTRALVRHHSHRAAGHLREVVPHGLLSAPSLHTTRWLRPIPLDWTPTPNPNSNPDPEVRAAAVEVGQPLLHRPQHENPLYLNSTNLVGSGLGRSRVSLGVGIEVMLSRVGGLTSPSPMRKTCLLLGLELRLTSS